MRISRHRTLLTIGLTALGLVVAAGPVVGHSGGDGDGHRGKVGRHAFIDSERRPGARCFYHATEPTTDIVADLRAELVGVGVRPPKVAALNRTPGIDHGRVGWRFILFERKGDSDWKAVKRSPLQIRRTTDRRAANFSRMGVRYDGDPEAEYRVRTKAIWFGRRLRRIGVASHVVDYYAIGHRVAKGSCPGGIPVGEAP